MHCMALTSSESDQYSSTQKEMSKLPLKYMTGYFCRSVYLVHKNVTLSKLCNSILNYDCAWFSAVP